MSISYKISDHLNNLKYIHISNSVFNFYNTEANIAFAGVRTLVIWHSNNQAKGSTHKLELVGMPYYDISDTTKFRPSSDHAVLTNFIDDYCVKIFIQILRESKYNSILIMCQSTT